MSKKKSAKQVPLPDINALAEKQFAQQQIQSDKALQANRANQVNQFGSINWVKDPTSGMWTQTEAYNPEQQALLAQQLRTQGVLGRGAEELAGTMDLDYSGAPALPTVGGYQQEATDTIRALQAPQIAARENADRARRAAMGLTGGERITATSEQNLNDQASRADMQAILAGMERGDTMFGQGITARNTYTGEQDRMAKNVGGMMGSAAPVDLQFGDYAKQGVVNAPDYAGNAMAMWRAQQDQANAKAASKSSGGMFGGLGTLAGAGIGAFFGGPAGAKLGSSIGGAAGGMFDK